MVRKELLISLGIGATLVTTWTCMRTATAEDAVAPFPPGEGALLTRQTCTRCHGANLVISRHFDEASAERYWRTMVGTDPNSPEALKVIIYLSTVLGNDDNGPDDVLR